jgi:hypothetical protein
MTFDAEAVPAENPHHHNKPGDRSRPQGHRQPSPRPNPPEEDPVWGPKVRFLRTQQRVQPTPHQPARSHSHHTPRRDRDGRY